MDNSVKITCNFDQAVKHEAALPVEEERRLSVSRQLSYDCQVNEMVEPPEGRCCDPCC